MRSFVGVSSEISISSEILKDFIRTSTLEWKGVQLFSDLKSYGEPNSIIFAVTTNDIYGSANCMAMGYYDYTITITNFLIANKGLIARLLSCIVY